MTSIILIVDDERDKAELIWGSPLKEDYGWTVHYAGGYAEALQYLGRSQPDVVLLDRQMHDPDTGLLRKEVGDELLEKIVFGWPDICPIMLTNNADMQSAKSDTRCGAFEYFDKQVTHSLLDRACRNGMAFRSIERESPRFLGMETVEEMVAHARDLLTALWFSQADPCEFEFTFFRFAPGSSCLEVLPGEAVNESKNDERSQVRFVTPDPIALSVLNSRHWLISNLTTKGFALETVRCRVCVPVFDVERTIQGLLWLESTEPNAVDPERARMLQHLATFIGYGLTKFKLMHERGADASDVAQDWFSKTLFRSLCYPLQAAQSELELLSSELADSHVQQSVALRLRSLSQSLEQAVQYSVELRQSRISFEERLVNLANIVRRSIDAIVPVAEAHQIEIRSDVSPRMPQLTLDPFEMRYAIDCLLENSLDAIKERRHVTNEPDIKGEISVKVDVDPSGERDVLLSIVDNGCGITIENLPKVFDRYFTTKERVLRDGHSSMGLSQVKRLIESFHGTIEAARAPKGGAEFTILLPVKQPAGVATSK